MVHNTMFCYTVYRARKNSSVGTAMSFFLGGDCKLCGRYTLTRPLHDIVQHFVLHDVRDEVEERYAESFNVAPSQHVLVIGLRRGQRAAALHRWGLIPHWAKEPSIGSRMINARSETVCERPAYREAFRLRRCLIPADGLYEWQHMEKRKQPFRFTLRNKELFAFAGLWDEWRSPDGTAIRSCTILTTEPNELIQPVHNRMPVILPPEAYDTWLDPHARPKQLLPLLQPYPSELMTGHAVSPEVNSPRNNDPSLITPVMG